MLQMVEARGEANSDAGQHRLRAPDGAVLAGVGGADGAAADAEVGGRKLRNRAPRVGRLGEIGDGELRVRIVTGRLPTSVPGGSGKAGPCERTPPWIDANDRRTRQSRRSAGCARSGSAGKASRIRTPLAIRPASRTPVGRLRDRRRRPHVATHIPIATGERIFTKWVFKEILEKRAAAILQPDVCYAGGITELKIIGGMLLTGPNLGITIDEYKLEAEVG